MNNSPNYDLPLTAVPSSRQSRPTDCLTTYDLLYDDRDYPSLYLIDCRVNDNYLIAQLGYLLAGLRDREYNLQHGSQYICTVKLPKLALNLPKDVACILNQTDSHFEVINGLRLHTNNGKSLTSGIL